MPLLSLCLIARNEERMLPGLLESVRGAVDEVVLVDTGSTDQTMALARAAGARVVERPWDDDFSAPRNTAAQAATGRWILQLDADERLAPGAGPTLRRLLERGPAFDCGMLALHNASSLDAAPSAVVSGAARLGPPMWLPRVLRRTRDLRYDGVIHENVSEWLASRGSRPERIPGVDLVHLGVAPGYREARGKVARNLTLLRKACEGDAGNVLPFSYLALELIDGGQLDEARAVVERGWALVATQPAHRSCLRIAIARCQLALQAGDEERVFETVATLERREALPRDLCFYRGYAYESRAGRRPPAEAVRDREAAIADFARCQGDGWPQVDADFTRGAAGWASAIRQGTNLVVLARWDEAERALTTALATAPAEAAREARLGLVEVSLGRGDAAGALQAVMGLLGEEADGWALAASAALLSGARADAELLFSRARERRGRLVARHRRALLAALEGALGTGAVAP